MKETKPIKSIEDIEGIVPGDIVNWGSWDEKCLCYDYIFTNEEELFLLGRFPMTAADISDRAVGVVYNHRNNVYPEDGHLQCRLLWGKLPRTKDSKFHYGINILEAEKDLELFKKFDEALREAGL